MTKGKPVQHDSPSPSSNSQADSEDPAETETHGRRRFLQAIGLGAGAVVVGPPAAALARGRDRRGGRESDAVQQAQLEAGGRRRRRGRGGRDTDEFSRMFNRQSFAEPSRELRAALAELGGPGGILDANDPLEVGPIRLITEPELSPNNRDNPTHTAGTTFVGQFLDHDITRDAGSRLGRPTSLRRSTNLRSASFDLDSVYGGGPAESPELYDGHRFIIETGGRFEDVPRDEDGVAIIADPRNDENLMISGLQAAFLMFHNAVMDRVEATGLRGDAAFEQARRQVRWHWQWLIVHHFLPQFVGQAMVDDIAANGRRFYTPQVPQIPVEFQTAAYRFGHSMVRPSYRANMAGVDGEPFFGFVFDPSQFGQDDPDDLAGRSRAPRRYVGWQTFFDFGDGEVRPPKRIDTKMSTPLFQLPIHAIGAERGEDVGPLSLATRNLWRHLTWEIPSGQVVAAEMNASRLPAADLADFGQFGFDLDTSTPLWLYILREADVMHDGLHLGEVGGRIVAEVFMGLLELDDESYLSDPSWRPTLGPTSGEFEMTDLLTIAGVDPTSRGE